MAELFEWISFIKRRSTVSDIWLNYFLEHYLSCWKRLLGMESSAQTRDPSMTVTLFVFLEEASNDAVALCQKLGCNPLTEILHSL